MFENFFSLNTYYFLIDNASEVSFERYKPQFKYTEKLDAKKLPNSIKTTRPNALPNELVNF